MTTYPVPLEKRLADMLSTLQRRVTLLESRSVTAVSAALDPVSGGPETWHNMTLLNGWVVSGAPDIGAVYRLNGSGYLHIMGCIKSGTSIGVAALPSQYAPAHYIHFPVAVLGVAPGAGTEGYVDTSANVRIVVPAGTTRVDFNAVIPLDA